MNLDKKARIHIGAPIAHDHAIFTWPACKPPNGGRVAKDPHMLFDVEPVELNEKRMKLRAPGYGKPNDYGNGAIMVDYCFLTFEV